MSKIFNFLLLPFSGFSSEPIHIDTAKYKVNTIEMPGSIEIAFRSDFEKLGGDLRKAMDKTIRSSEVKVVGRR